VTDRPYTDADLIAEAARQHHDLTEDPDYMGVGEQMEYQTITSAPGLTWDQLGDDDYDSAQEAIHDLIGSAADTSRWAVTLGAAGLTPNEPFAVRSTTGGWQVAVQVATNPEIRDDAHTRLLAEIRTAVDDAVCRVLGMLPITPTA
jgi:hypothetical protein